MVESSNYNRIIFDKKGVQRNFILKAQNVLNINGGDFSKKLHVSQRTLTDWKREKFKISVVSAKHISKLTHIPIPKNHQIIDWVTHLKKAGAIGAKIKFTKYGNVGGNENYRKKKWKEWWDKTGKYKKPAPGFMTSKKIKVPKKSKLLAEFIGMLLGDGNISNYYISITLSSEEVQYREYVKKVIENLFDITPRVFKHKDSKSISIVVNRKLLVEFCQKIGFEKGNKVTHQVDIPMWIKKNKSFALECVRGLIDTDGCFFTHSYIINGKKYSYLKIAFTSASAPLRSSVAEILINSGFSVRMSNVRIKSNGRDIRIDDTQYVNKYIQEIGSHNQKHLNKIEKWKVALNGKAAVC